MGRGKPDLQPRSAIQLEVLLRRLKNAGTVRGRSGVQRNTLDRAAWLDRRQRRSIAVNTGPRHARGLAFVATRAHRQIVGRTTGIGEARLRGDAASRPWTGIGAPPFFSISVKTMANVAVPLDFGCACVTLPTSFVPGGSVVPSVSCSGFSVLAVTVSPTLLFLVSTLLVKAESTASLASGAPEARLLGPCTEDGGAVQ